MFNRYNPRRQDTRAAEDAGEVQDGFDAPFAEFQSVHGTKVR